MKTLYHDIIMDHFKYPRNKGVLEAAHIISSVHNPSCGDTIQLFGIVSDGKIQDISFQGSGCAISQAAASLLTEKVKGQSLDAICRLTKDDMQQLIGIPLGPNRLKCALLALEALIEGIHSFRAQE